MHTSSGVAASVGYALGTIFDQKQPTRWLAVYWAAALGLVGPFLGLLIGAGLQPYPTAAQRAVAASRGALAGILFGLLVGTTQLKRLRRRSQSSREDVIH